MSATPPDDTLARLNYFNGQRLAAGDLRTEQQYHMGMRRVLNRSLYSPGIVVGLEVEPDKADPAKPSDMSWKHRVVVRHGLAFDHLGREIFLPVDVKVQISGAPSTTPGVVFGNLLVIAYREQRSQPVSNRCMVGAPCQPCSGDLPWGAPTRIVADAMFEVLDSWPAEDSGKILLSQVELGSGCQVTRTAPGVRRYAVPVKPQTVRPISIEGEKDIDQSNPKVLYFHIDGGAPDSAILHLRARPFSTLWYSELGQHTHHLQLNTQSAGFVSAHTHPIDLTKMRLADDGEHRHEIWAGSDDDESGSVDFGDGNDPNSYPATGPGGVRGGRAMMEVKPGGKHSHGIVDGSVPSATGSAGEVPAHVHAINSDSNATGLLPAARVFPLKALSYVDDLRVTLDGHDVTALICAQLESHPGAAGQWPKLGDGTSNQLLAHPEGTGEINLMQLGVELGLGTHTLEFRVLKPNIGGNVQYNLYVG